METIVAAAISALASIIVAWIGRSRITKLSTAESSSGGQESRKQPRLWVASVLVIFSWIIVASFLTKDPELLVINALVLVPIIAVALAYFTLPPPLLAASAVFAIHAVNATVMSFSDVPGYMIAGVTDVLILLGIFALNALLAAGAARWSAKRRHRDSIETSPAEAGTNTQLASELARLAELHAKGSLSNEEFHAAKKKLLD
jgi:hypothetical protein